MASLRSGLLSSPAAATRIMSPVASKSILKRPTPLPLSPISPSPFFTATFSITASPSTGKLSPYIRFPASPSPVVATFSAQALSPNPSSCRGIDIPAANHLLSPNGSIFKLANPLNKLAASPSGTSAGLAHTLAVPRTSFEDPRSPKPYRYRTLPVQGETRFLAPLRSATVPVPSRGSTLEPPSPFLDPRSPKPYQASTNSLHHQLEEIILHVPCMLHASDDLGRALSTYPRSPYPSAPVATANEESAIGLEIVGPGLETANEDAVAGSSERGRGGSKTFSQHARTRSLEIESSTATSDKRQPAGPENRLSSCQSSDFSESRLNSAFWDAVTLQPPQISGTPSPV